MSDTVNIKEDTLIQEKSPSENNNEKEKKYMAILKNSEKIN